MKYKHTNRPGFLLGIIDFFTAGIFFLLYMPLGGLQNELEDVLGHKVLPYWKAYVLGIPTLFIYTVVWMARIAEELKEKAIELGLKGPYTSCCTCSAGIRSGFCSLVRLLPPVGFLIR